MLSKVIKLAQVMAMAVRPGETSSATFASNNKAMVDKVVAAVVAVTTAVVAVAEAMVAVVETTVEEALSQVMVRCTSKRKYRR